MPQLPTPALKALIEIHKGLFPERYLAPEEMERQGLHDQWDSGTIEWVAGRIEDALAGEPSVVLDPTFRPLDRRERVERTLRSSGYGTRFTTNELELTKLPDENFLCLVSGEDARFVDDREAADLLLEEFEEQSREEFERAFPQITVGEKA